MHKPTETAADVRAVTALDTIAAAQIRAAMLAPLMLWPVLGFMFPA